jgi:hypothetical protein
MQKIRIHAPRGRSWQIAWLALTLITSAVHFSDNAFHLDLYPGPVWLTRNVVLASWLILPTAACVAYWMNTKAALTVYALLGFGGLTHYLMPYGMNIPLRCTMTIAAEAAASTILLAYTFLRPHLRNARR